MSRPFHQNGVDRLYGVDCDEPYRAKVRDCRPRYKCPEEPIDLYVPVSVSSCERNVPPEIPHVNVENISEARAFPNHYVFVEEMQVWVHVDQNGGVATLSNSFLYKDNFVPSDYEGVYKNVVIYDFAKEKQYVFNPAGQYMVFSGEVKMNEVLGEGI